MTETKSCLRRLIAVSGMCSGGSFSRHCLATQTLTSHIRWRNWESVVESMLVTTVVAAACPGNFFFSTGEGRQNRPGLARAPRLRGGRGMH